MKVFKSDLDYNFLESASFEDIVNYAKTTMTSERFLNDPDYKPLRRASILRVICTMLNITPNAQQWAFLLADCDRVLNEAIAGAGKTTMSQLKLIDEKLTHNVPGRNILALAYNRHAAADMMAKHEAIISKINQKNIPELKRDSQLCCSTFHSFCKCWVEDYPSRFNIRDLEHYLITDADQRTIMNLAMETYAKTSKKQLYIADTTVASMVSLAAFVSETLSSTDTSCWKLSTAFSDLVKSDYTIEDCQSIIEMYNRGKRLRNKFDFQDLISSMYTLCCDPAVMKRIRTVYKVFLVDEFQDITPSMMRILRLIMNGDPELGIEPFYDSKFICIGDGDQSIYGFRGTSPDNCISFKEYFELPGMLTRITTMSENLRCPTNIVDHARHVIESNEQRIQKPMHGVREGGSVEPIYYNSLDDQLNKLITYLKAVPPDRRSCICYRNLSSSYALTLRLMEEGIPFKIGSGHEPLSDRISQSILQALNMLSFPTNGDNMQQSLFKLLPKSVSFTKKTLSDIITAATSHAGSPTNFWELPFPEEVKNITGFTAAIETLRKCHYAHRKNLPMKDYVPAIIKLLHVYYIDWQLTKGLSLEEDYIKYIETAFSGIDNYDNFMKKLGKLREANKNFTGGIYLTSFHGLKGLEFDTVYVIDLNDKIFPGTELNQSQYLSTAQKDMIESEARRLYYVVITRPKDRLLLFFDKNCPCRYERFTKINSGLDKIYESYTSTSTDYTGKFTPGALDIKPTEGEFFVANLSGAPEPQQLHQVAADDVNIDIDADDLEETELDIDIDIDSEAVPVKTSINPVDPLAAMRQQQTILKETLSADNYQKTEGKPVLQGILAQIAQKYQ